MLESADQQQFLTLLAGAVDRVVLTPELAGRMAGRDGARPFHDDRRRHPRKRFVVSAVLEVCPTYPHIPRGAGRYRVLTSDLSRSGISLLHAEQLFPGERLVLWLPSGRLAAIVTRCRRHHASCWEIGAEFERAAG